MKVYRISDQDVLNAMERYGGSFVSALAVAWQRADMINQAKLRTAFGNYWEHYSEMAELEKNKQEAGI
ncbi:MAG: hypothetical protein WAN65_00655 [Candidatus Sulfotelmatobacter sp.]